MWRELIWDEVYMGRADVGTAAFGCPAKRSERRFNVGMGFPSCTFVPLVVSAL
jgi:hypothetical protein